MYINILLGERQGRHQRKDLSSNVSVGFKTRNRSIKPSQLVSIFASLPPLPELSEKEEYRNGSAKTTKIHRRKWYIAGGISCVVVVILIATSITLSVMLTDAEKKIKHFESKSGCNNTTENYSTEHIAAASSTPGTIDSASMWIWSQENTRKVLQYQNMPALSEFTICFYFKTNTFITPNI